MELIWKMSIMKELSIIDCLNTVFLSKLKFCCCFWLWVGAHIQSFDPV